MSTTPITSAPPNPTAPSGFEGEDFSVGKLIDTFVKYRLLVGVCTGVITLVGLLYATMARPIYESNLVIQVEESSNSLSGVLGQQAANFFEVKSVAGAEIEILRSRMVVSRAVDSLGLYVHATPKRMPVIGNWVARNREGLSSPGLFGHASWGGYTWGQESIRVSRLDVPEDLQYVPFILTTEDAGRYQILVPGLARPASGQVGQSLHIELGVKRSVDLLVTQMEARPGAQFELMRSSRLDVIQELQAQLQITERGRQTGILGATLEGADPEKTTAILNEIGREFVRQNVERKAEEAANTLKFLEKQLPDIKKELEAAESRYIQFRATQGSVDLEEEGKNLLQQLVKVETSLFELRQKKADYASRYNTNHPQMLVLAQQINETEENIRLINLKVRGLPQIQQDVLRISRDVKVNSELYANLLNSAQQLRLVRAGKVGNVRLIDAAVVPEAPVKPRRLLVVLVSLVVGFLVGMGAAFLRRALHDSIDDPHDIERELGQSVYATIPHSAQQVELSEKVVARAPGLHVLAHFDSFDPAIEGLRSLRTALQLILPTQGSPLVMVTGPAPGLGKSFIAVNLAAVLAPLAKRRVLLVDADLRRGYLHQYFGLKRERGFSDVVAGQIDVADAIHRDILPGLDFLSTGTIAPNPSDLLMHPRCAQLLTELGQQYEQVIFDTPPVLVVSDAMSMVQQMGAIFLVAREGHTTLGEVDESVRSLVRAGGNFTGVLFNDMHPRLNYGALYGGNYRYKYRYRYRYKYRYQRYNQK